ncbi:MAG: DUF6722 family protein [bacterium]
MKRLRHIEISKMFLDIAKYIITIVIIGSLINEKVTFQAVLIGCWIAVITFICAVLLLPKEE